MITVFGEQLILVIDKEKTDRQISRFEKWKLIVYEYDDFQFVCCLRSDNISHHFFFRWKEIAVFPVHKRTCLFSFFLFVNNATQISHYLFNYSPNVELTLVHRDRAVSHTYKVFELLNKNIDRHAIACDGEKCGDQDAFSIQLCYWTT